MQKLTSKDFRRNLGQKWKLATDLDAAIKNWDRSWSYIYQPKVKDLAFHPSSHCTPLVTELWHMAMDRIEGHDEVHGATAKKAFQVGHFFHQYIQNVIVDMGWADEKAIERRGSRSWRDYYQSKSTVGDITVLRQPPFSWSEGAADIAPCVIPKHGEYVVDIKTMNSNAFRQIEIPRDYAFKYLCQINIYMDYFDIDRGLILCVNKDSPHDMKEYEYRRNDTLITHIYNKWQYVGELIGDDLSPGDEDDELFAVEEIL